MQPETFQPDDEYCAYCHAIAAGPCAECGALCCGDCVEVVLRFTSRRAVCKPCLAEASRRDGGSRRRWIAAALAATAIVILSIVLARA
jgi:hypothetical protein